MKRNSRRRELAVNLLGELFGSFLIAVGVYNFAVICLLYTSLLEVFGERMIERQISQLHEAGVTDIYIMVGYLKEKFEYLIDKYDIKLIYNPEYASKNTLATVYHAQDIMRGRNMYLLPSDNWLRENKMCIRDSN